MSGATFNDKLNNEPDLLANGQVSALESVKSDHDQYCGKYPKCFRCMWCVCGTFLFLFAVQATFLPALLRSAVSSGIEDALIFTSAKPDDSHYLTWLTNVYGDDAVPIWVECRFFNVTNKDEILNPPTDPDANWTFPKLHLTPPLIYDEMYLKYAVNFSFNNLSENAEWVEYKTWKYYTVTQKQMYREQIGPKTHVVIVSPIIGALYYEWLWPKNGSALRKYGAHELSKLLNNVDPNLLFWEGTAEEILFNISQINITVLGNHLLAINLNKGLLDNGTAPGSPDNSTYEVAHTGHNAPHRMAEVLLYGGKEKGWIDCYDTPMQIWPAKDTFFGVGNVRKHDQQSIFVNTLYKNIALNYNYSYNWKHDIELYRYTVQMLPQYANASMWPPNKQFNLFGTSGVQNLTSCMKLPIFVSFPEFLGADDFIVNNTKMGLVENPPWDWLPYVDIEPRTGGIYKANKSLQLNTVIHSLPFNYSIDINRSVPFTESQIYFDRSAKNRALWGNKSLHWIADDLVVPMIEMSECTELPEKQAKAFSNQVIATTHWAKRLEWIGVACGCLFAAWATLCGWAIAKRYYMAAANESISRSWFRWLFLIIITSNGVSYGVNRYILVPIQDQVMAWYSINSVEYNLLMTLYSWPNILCSVICGILIDKFSVRKVLSLSWILDIIGLTLIVMSCIRKDYILLCIGRTIVGIGNEGLSISLKLYVIQFFNKSEYGIVFGVYLAFITLGSGFNTFVSYQVYEWLGIVYSMSISLFIAPFVSIPLFILMYLETYSWNDNYNKHNKYKTAELENEYTKLIEEGDNTAPDDTKNKFKLKHIKTLPIYYWILLLGFVIWCGAAQASLNIAVSYLHHMFAMSYAFATAMSLFTNPITIISYLASGLFSSKMGKLTDMLLFANIVGFFGHYIYGWHNTQIYWAFIGGTLQAMSLGFTYPVVWAAIPLLVDPKVKGTAYGFATAIRFFVIAVSYMIVGVLTNARDGKSKYIDVQLYVIWLVLVSTVFYIVLFGLDIKYNYSVLRIVHSAENKPATTNKETDVDISMQKMSM